MAEKEKMSLTKAGKEQLEAELSNLVNVVRPQVIVELQEARAQGDLSENADYDAARKKQAEVEGRIKEIEYILQNSIIVDEKSTGAKNVIKLHHHNINKEKYKRNKVKFYIFFPF